MNRSGSVWRAVVMLAITTATVGGAQSATSPVRTPISTTSISSGTDTIHLDLPGSVRTALENATAIQIGADSVRFSAISLLESYGRFLPSLTTTVGAFSEAGNTLLSSTSLAPADAQFYGFGTQLSAGVNLFNGYRDREHAKASVALHTAALDGFDRVRQQVAFDVSQAFFQVVLDRRLRDVAAANLDLSRARQGQLEEQVRAGTRAPPDLYRQQAQVSADEFALIDAQNRVDTDGRSLLLRLRVDPTRPYTIIEPLPDTTLLSADSLRPDDLVARALRVRPDITAQMNRTDADQHEMTAARGGTLPKVALRFDAAVSGRIFDREMVRGVDQLTVPQRSIFDQLGNQWTRALTLGVSWDVFDNYRARLDIERATVSLDRDRLATDDLRLRVATQVQQALGDYRAAEQKLKTTAAGLESAQQAFDAVQGRFDVDLATFVDVLSAQTTLTQARALREQAVANMALQKTVLRYAVGDLVIPNPTD